MEKKERPGSRELFVSTPHLLERDLLVSLLNDSHVSNVGSQKKNLEAQILESARRLFFTGNREKRTQPISHSKNSEPYTKEAPTIFRERKTLRELMGQYNNRSSKTSGRLLKNYSVSPNKDSFFEFDRVESIQLPNIPGKILRPR